MKRYGFYAQRAPFGRGIAIYMSQVIGDELFVANDVVLSKAIEGEMSRPMVDLDLTAAQQLMDELWLCGLRPTEGSGSAGSLAATERHLADMRRLVFKETP